MGALWLAWWWVPAAEAAVWKVGAVGQFTPGAVTQPSIAAAIAAAANGDVIEIGQGSFDERLTIDNKRLTLRSASTGAAPLLFTTTAQAAMTVTNGAVVTFDGLSWTTRGGRRCMRVLGTTDVVLDDVAFNDCQHNDAGAALYVQAGAAVEAFGVDFTTTIDPITVADKGGGHAWVQGELHLHGGLLRGATASQGGSILVDGGALTAAPLAAGMVEPVRFEDNAAVTDGALPACGGAICVLSGTASLDGVDLYNNRSDAAGGHLAARGGAILDLGSVWTLGEAPHGGAIDLSGGATAALTASVLRANLATGAAVSDGGAIRAFGSGAVTLDGVELAQNEADGRGGAVWLGVSGLAPSLTLSGTLRQNHANAGGALWLDAGTSARVHNATFDSDDAGGGPLGANGGAVAADRPASLLIEDTRFDDNHADGDGGALWWLAAGAPADLRRVTVTGASAARGGALALSGGATLDAVILRSNTATTGAGLWSDAGALDVVRSQLCLNVASGDGGGAWLGAATATFRATELQENSAVNGAAVRATSAALTLSHVHALGNRVTGAATGGAVALNATTLQMQGALVGWTETGRGVTLTGGAATATRNAFWSNAGANVAGFVSASSITVDPLLAGYDRDGGCTDDRPWPSWTSPLRDQATGLDPDGTPADIGAFGGADAAGTAPWTTDGDADAAVFMRDCDDAAAAIRPGAAELPGDGVDQDCDRAEACYVDADLDGAPGPTLGPGPLTCAAAGFGVAPTDCDDGDAAERPGVTWHRDDDADGWGGAVSATCARAAPTDVSRGGDCDDAATDRNPGAAEAPGNGVDNDCDGLEACHRDVDRDGFGRAETVEIADLSCTTAGYAPTGTDCDDADNTERPDVTWYPDADRDGAGANVAGRACQRAAASDVTLTGDCNDARADVRPGADEVVGDNFDQDCDGRERCYQDLDRDGFGRTTTALAAGLSCAEPGLSTRSDDCDDDASDDTIAAQAARMFPGSRHYPDADGDGYGRASPSVVACLVAPGYSVLNTDCDDEPADDTIPGTAALVYPGATWWADGDADGWGRADSPLTPPGCSQPAGYAPRADDCVDTDRAVYPGAPYRPDRDGDGFGDAAQVVSDPAVCRVPAGFVTTTGDCDDDPSDDLPGAAAAQIWPGAPYFVDRDGDRWGSGAGVAQPGRCVLPAGWATRGGDCEDDPTRTTPGAEAAGIYPGATSWLDRDGDRWGDDASAVPTAPPTCGLPAGHATRGGDCDDQPADDRIPGDAARTFPGARYGRDDDADGWGSGLDTTAGACAPPPGFAPSTADCDDVAVDDRVPGDAAATFPGATYYRDRDGDGFGRDTTTISDVDVCTPDPGYVPQGGDCDDGTDGAAIFPGATYWSDRDGDGFGDPALPLVPEVCGLPAAASLNALDCDDDPSDDRPGAEAAGVYPGAVRYPDLDGDGWGASPGVPDPTCGLFEGYATRGGDCVDDPAADLPGRTAAGQYPGATFWLDGDGDGFGAPGTALSAPEICALAPGLSTSDADCDDAEPRVFPGAAYALDLDGDGFGSLPAPSDCALPAGASLVGGDCDDDAQDDRPGAEASAIFPGAAYWPDVDGDGYGAITGGPSLTPAACGLPAGYSTRADDCDDDPADDAPPAQIAARLYPGAPVWADLDGDGWGGAPVPVGPDACAPDASASLTPGDCDDDPTDDTPSRRAANLYPGAPSWPDLDGDGWGAGPATSDPGVCEPPPGRALRDGDCDDDPADDTVAAAAALIFPGAVYFPDVDGDGWGAGAPVRADCALPEGASVRGDDCDDDPTDDDPGRAAADSHPGAAWFFDLDGDAWGGASSAIACEGPPGEVSRGGDCDDDARDDTPGSAAAGVYPGATYTRDADSDGWGDPARAFTPPTCGLPEGAVTRPGDCDDDARDDVPSALAARIFPGATYFTDADGDGWGDPAAPLQPEVCGLPAGAVTRAGDCDDAAPDAIPGGAELPGNDLDEDCDGQTACWLDVDGDGFGSGPLVPDDGDRICDGPGEAAADGDCDDDPADDDDRVIAAWIAPGNPEVCGDGVDSDCSCLAGACDDDAGDEDGDGLSWADELRLGASDCDADSDDDGLPDTVEVALGTRPNADDTDADGVPDGVEAPGGAHRNRDCDPELPAGTVCDDLPDALDPDDDGDGVPTALEGVLDADCAALDDLRLTPDGLGAWLDPDTDGDGTPDLVEAGQDLDNDGIDDRIDCETGDPSGDPDCDGLSNALELTLGADPRDPDSDDDGLADSEELAPDQTHRFSDADALPDLLDPDDDGDGVPTAEELRLVCPDGAAPTTNAACPAVPLLLCADGAAPVPANTDAPRPGSPWPRAPDDTPDWLDADDDGDGTPTADQLGRDIDGDGAPDALDLDDTDGPAGDRDADGLDNATEAAQGSDPYRADTDGDGVSDQDERAGDSDGDGTPDLRDDDDDGDGVPTRAEGAADPDRDTIPARLDDDSDGDGTLDRDEPTGDVDCDAVDDRLDADDADGPCVSGLDTGDRVGFDAAPTGCACSAGSTVPPGARWLALGLALALRRRRR